MIYYAFLIQSVQLLWTKKKNEEAEHAHLMQLCMKHAHQVGTEEGEKKQKNRISP